ncbi:P-loop containing nucleoside triphosphate hydrolase protein [Mycena sp. CBHHK59/15]|nr:P-loop containing nucleoside triphosphate hydrolase protein [Mycena sp. CBHHK59/15]
MEGIEVQLQIRDVLTMIAVGPHSHPTSAGKVTLMISPLIALHDEQVETFRDEFKLKATAINSSNGGCKVEVLQLITSCQEIVRRDYHIVLISPEMALSRRFICEVLRSTEFGRRILSVVVDEAHVVSNWGASFLKKCGRLGMIRAFLPRGTPIVALSAMLPARIRNDVLSKLQFVQDYVNINVGNDRPNISIVVRGIQHLLNTYVDLDFIIAGVKGREDIKKTFIYANNIMTSEYQRKAMSMFKEGAIRILVCTDAAGMGCNIPDIDVVVQWKLPASMSLFVQRAGRTAWAQGRTRLAILLVEPSAYRIDLAEGNAAKTMGGRTKKKAPEKEKESNGEKHEKAKKKKEYAKARGVRWGSAGGKHDTVFVVETPALDPEAQDEGLLVFDKPTVPCCDICCLELLDQTCPGKPPVVPHQSAVKCGEINKDVQLALHQWQSQSPPSHHPRLLRHVTVPRASPPYKYVQYPTLLYSVSSIMRDETITLLSLVRPIPSRMHLQTILAGQWTWWEDYGEELYACLAVQTIPPMIPLPSKNKKRFLNHQQFRTRDTYFNVQTMPETTGKDARGDSGD